MLKKKITNVQYITIFMLGLIFSFIETDNFSTLFSSKAGALYTFSNVWTYGDVVTKIYFIVVYLLTLGTFFFFRKQASNIFPFKFFFLSSLFLIGSLCVRLSIEQGIIVGTLGTDTRILYTILFLPITIYSISMYNVKILIDFILGFTSGVILKFPILILAYITTGGLELMRGVNSLVIDGGVLTSVSIVLLLSFGFFLYKYEHKKKGGMIVNALIMILSMIILASSFRRSILLRAFLLIFVSFVFFSYSRGKLISRSPVLIIVPLLSFFVISITYVVNFGYDASLERLHSISSSDEGEYSGSNKFYSEDQAILGEVLTKTSFLGCGLNNSYGISDRTQMGEDIDNVEVEVPLHVGILELLARSGLFAIPFLISLVLIVPILIISRIRRATLESQILGSLSASWLFVNGAWIFEPPPYTQTILWYSFSLALAVGAYAVTQENYKTSISPTQINSRTHPS